MCLQAVTELAEFGHSGSVAIAQCAAAAWHRGHGHVGSCYSDTFYMWLSELEVVWISKGENWKA